MNKPHDRDNPKPEPKYRLEKPKRSKPRRSGADALIATALMAQGLTPRSVERVTGIPATTVRRLAHENVIAPEHIERVKRHLKDRFALIAADALASIDADKLKKAGFGETMRGAAIGAQMAGLTTSVHEHFHSVMGKYSVQVVEPQPVEKASIPMTIPIGEPAMDQGIDDGSGEGLP